MKFIKHFLASFLLIALMHSGYAQSSNFGVNLAGLDFGPTVLPGTAGKDYFIPTNAELDYYKSKGLSLIRLPFLWERAQPTLGGDLDPTYMGIIDGIVTAAADRNMSIILDMHNYGRYPQAGKVIGATGGPTLANFQDVWAKIALRYTDQTAVWGFDLMNEPHNLGTTTWFDIAQAGITAIRTKDQTHVILVEGDNWSKGNTWTQYNNTLKNLSDPNSNLVFEAHQYFDSDQSGQYLASRNNNTVAGAGANANTGVAYITPFVDWLNANNLKGIVGEYGVPNNNDLENWNQLLTNFMDYIQQNCVGGTYWAGGPAWGPYITSIEPTKSGSTYIDAPQMSILTNYTSLPSGCSLSSNNITISLTAPTDHATFNEGNSILLTANATVVEGTIAQVDFYSNGTLIGTSTTSPYTFTWDNVSAGTYVLKAKATTNTGQAAASLAKTVFVAETVYNTTAMPVIDGVAEPLWDAYAANSLNKVLLGTVSSSSYLSATWKATYDAKNLYVLVTVMDQTLVNSNTALYNDDGIEIYFDNGNTKTVSYNLNQFQYAFGWNDVSVNEYIHNATTGVIFAQTNQGVTDGCTNNCDAQGYTMEVLIPWSTLGVTNPVQGIFEGFEVMVNDDNAGTRVAKIAWTATTDNAWQEPSLFGTVNLACSQPLAAPAIATNGSTTFCNGTPINVVLTTDTDNGVTYQWLRNNKLISGATNTEYQASAAGNYTITTTEDNCLAGSSVISILIDSTIANAGPDQYKTETHTTLAANKPFTNNTGTWTILNGTGTFEDASLYNTTVTNLSEGINTFIWKITSDSCGSSQDNVAIHVSSQQTSISTAVSGKNYAVMPNPFQTTSAIVLTGSNTDPVTITITDLKGSILVTYANQDPNSTITIGDNLLPGIYLVRIQQGFDYSMLKLIKTL